VVTESQRHQINLLDCRSKPETVKPIRTLSTQRYFKNL